MDVGTMLRTARERRALSVAELAATTKIPVSLLKALEENDFARVPRGIFVRGYLRAYAREVGLDSEEVIEQFLAETGEMPPAAAAQPSIESRTIDEEIDDVRIDPELSGSGPGWGYVLIVAALLVAVISFNRDSSSEAPGVASVPLVEEDVAATLQAVADELQPVATAGQGLRFEMRAEGPCWVEAIVDGRRIVYRLMQPGERETIDVNGEVVLRVGDPAALSYSVNGRPGEPLGQAGIPITVRFTSEGRREELAS